MIKNPTNISELRNSLSTDVYTKLLNGEIKPGVASEANNAAGKIINTIKVQLEACALAKTIPNIKFLDE